MRIALFAILALASPALAEPAAKPPDAKPATSCKRVVVGRGLDRHVVCELPEIVLKEKAPRPNVLVVTHDGRNVTGRPRANDRLSGLSHQLR